MSCMSFWPPPMPREEGPDPPSEATKGAATVTVILAEWEIVPLVPVTVTVNDPTALPVTDNVAVPVPPEERVTVFGASEAVTLVEEVVVASEIDPENLLRLFNFFLMVRRPPRSTL